MSIRHPSSFACQGHIILAARRRRRTGLLAAHDGQGADLRHPLLHVAGEALLVPRLPGLEPGVEPRAAAVVVHLDLTIITPDTVSLHRI